MKLRFFLVLLAVVFSRSLSERARLLGQVSASGELSAVHTLPAQSPQDVSGEEAESSDSAERTARRAKSMRYNGGGCDITALKPGHSCFFEQVWPRGLPVIPFKESTIALTGQVSKTQPYLSQDHTHIYTEVTIRIEEVFKNSPNSKIASGQTVVIDQLGGAIRMSSGQVVYDGTRTDFLGRTHLGGRYVLFAKKLHAGKDLTLIRGYQLRDGQVFKLTEDGRPGSSQVSTEKTFLQALREAAVQGKDDHRTGRAYDAPR